jgi:hypothetical protein
MSEQAQGTNRRSNDRLAWLVRSVIREMAEGKKGRKRVVNTMKLGVEWLYQHADARKLSFQALLFHLEGLTGSIGHAGKSNEGRDRKGRGGRSQNLRREAQSKTGEETEATITVSCAPAERLLADKGPEQIAMSQAWPLFSTGRTLPRVGHRSVTT